MNRFLIFTRFKNEYEPARLKQEAASLSLAPAVISYDSLLPEGGQGPKNADISAKFEFKPDDLVVMRSAAHFRRPPLTKLKYSLLAQIKNHQTCLNYTSFKDFPIISKLAQAQALSKAGLSSIPTTYLASVEAKNNFLRSANYPLIIKGNFGSHSRRVVRANSTAEALRIVRRLGSDLLIQPLYRSRYYWRVLILGGRGVGVMRRTTNSRFFDHGYEFDIDQSKLISLAIGAARLFQSEFAGIDLLADPNGRPVVIEVNRTPQFKIFEKLTGLDVANQLVRFLQTKLLETKSTVPK